MLPGLRTYLLNRQEMADADRNTSEEVGIPSLVLMERAALAVRDAILKDPETKSRAASGIYAVVVCGRGNNGADGLALARLLIDSGVMVSVLILKGNIREGSSFEVQLGILNKYNADISFFDEETATSVMERRPDIIVDAVSGTGLTGGLAGDAADAVVWCDACRESYGSRIYSVDIPSGVDCSDGSVETKAVRADVTVTFGYYKKGLFLPPGTGYAGRVIRADIGINDLALSDVPECFTYSGCKAEDLLPQRRTDGNKGSFGKILIVAGCDKICGAAYLSAAACIRAGAGMVRVFTHYDNRDVIFEKLPEALVTLYDPADMNGTLKALDEAIGWADVCAAGPGMSKSAAGRRILEEVLSASDRLKGIVLDADAIRMTAENASVRNLLKEASTKVPVILTPHMMEYAALSGTPLEMLKPYDRLIYSLEEVSSELGCVIICKDSRSTVYKSGEKTYYLNTSGNDGMATAGSGDVLTGITAAFLYAAGSAFEAACAAAYIHGKAGDQAAQRLSKAGMIASDIIDELPHLLLL